MVDKELKERADQIFRGFAEGWKKNGFSETMRFAIDVVQSPSDLDAVRYLESGGLVCQKDQHGSSWAFTPAGRQRARKILGL